MDSWRKMPACERAAQWLSLELDGELSTVEQAALVRHLTDCAPCRHLRAELVGVTGLLRAAPLAVPEREFVPALVRPRVRVARRAAFAATLAAAAVAFATLISTSSPFGQTQQAVTFTDRHQQLELVRHKYLEMEPLLSAMLAVSVPAISHQELR